MKSFFSGSAALSLLIASCTSTHAATIQELESKLESVTQQMQALHAELAELKAKQAAQASATAVSSSPTTTEAAAHSPTFFGYGELTYSHPREDASQASADLARFVLGVGYQFDERTHFNSELELEHAVSSADDPGEIEVEQAYIDRQLRDGLFAKAGLILMPVGLLNENHEPTRYYGVFRNFVETAIIPTTWREGALALQVNTQNGLRWDVGVSTGFDLSKWDGASSEGQESPLGSIHQELALARAKDLSAFGALNYTGILGLKVGASLFTGGASQGQSGFDSARVTLWEGHARWTPGNLDLSALYSRGHISGTQTINTAFVGNSSLIPERFFGWYLQGAYRIQFDSDFSISPFLRLERFNTASSYATIAAGLTPATLPDKQAWTTGLNFDIARGVVLKVDYLWFRHDPRFTKSDRFDLGLGYEF
jgi:hypothetical protein